MQRTPFNDDWTVRKEGEQERPVTLPHDAMISEIRDPNAAGGHNSGYFPGGRYHYSKTFVAPDDPVVVLEFEGVFHRSHVFLNGVEVGGRPSGYTTFHVPLHPHLVEGQNLLEVVVDTTDQPNSRWYTGSGIYRPISLMTGPAVHVSPFGPRILTDGVSAESASVRAVVDVVNEGDASADVEIVVDLAGPGGERTSARGVRTIPPGATETTELPLEVPSPALWFPESPNLYEATVSAVGLNGQEAETEAGAGSGPSSVTDRVTVATGIRSIQVDRTHGFRLNGESVNLRGACIHHDNGVLGAAEFDAAAERRIRLLKEAGFNAIRSSHNPTSNAILRACDRLGMLVVDEFADAWYFPKQVGDYGNDFEAWWRDDLTAMVLRDGHHPSVVMYSIGNEIAETSQPRGIELSRDMAQLVRGLDATVPITNGINLILNAVAPTNEKKAKQVAKARDQGEDQNKNLIVLLNYAMGAMEKIMPRVGGSKRADARSRDAFAPLDVAGYNYAPYRYRKDAELHPDRVILGTETNPPDIVENWALVEELPHVIGDFQWTGWDYLGEAGVAVKRYDAPRAMFLPYPALTAGEPVVDLIGNMQTQSYVNRIAFGLDRGPYLAVQPVDHAGEKQSKTPWRSSNSIRSWAWEGCEGREATVEVYADAARVELRLDGTLVGSGPSRRADGYLATFTVPWAPGTLEAVAFNDQGVEVGRNRLTSAGLGLRLVLEPDRDELSADGQDLAHIAVTLVDDDGEVRPLADRPVSVVVDGCAVLAGAGSANPITEDRYVSGEFSTFHGRGLAVVRSTHEVGEATVTVRAEGVEPVSIALLVG